MFYIYITVEANHNKAYAVVKTKRAGKLALFLYLLLLIFHSSTLNNVSIIQKTFSAFKRKGNAIAFPWLTSESPAGIHPLEMYPEDLISLRQSHQATSASECEKCRVMCLWQS